ncbi:MAG: 4-phosphopantoate--beta-alanine ligase [Candidatus Atabeyarchaeum deiterrae]
MSEIPETHPRSASLRIRERLIEGFKQGYVAMAGLIAHGRGEAFDYLIGELSIDAALVAAKVGAAALLIAKHPVISVNGNLAALAARETIELAQLTNSKTEVNLFYRTPERELIIEGVLKEAGASEVLGVQDSASATIPELDSRRRRVDPRGILVADVVLVPMEDGDRTEALRKMGKTVIAIDLNPISRTAKAASITIVDNVVRAMPNLVLEASKLKSEGKKSELERLVKGFDNRKNLVDCLSQIWNGISRLKKDGFPSTFDEDV